MQRWGVSTRLGVSCQRLLGCFDGQFTVSLIQCRTSGIDVVHRFGWRQFDAPPPEPFRLATLSQAYMRHRHHMQRLVRIRANALATTAAYKSTPKPRRATAPRKPAERSDHRR